MRRLIQIVSSLLVIGWLGWSANRLFLEDDRFLMVFVGVHATIWDWVACAGLVLAAIGFGWVSYQPRRRVGMWSMGVGLVLAILGGGAGVMFAFQRQDISSTITFVPTQKPNRSKTILGYYYRAPIEGGEVAFGDGAIRFVTAEEFASMPKATPPDRPGAWQSPTKSEAPAPIELAPGENPAMLTVRQAERRTQIGTDLRAIAEGHIFHDGQLERSPNDLPELMRVRPLDERQRAAVEDGTYVWFFGWDTTISQADKRAKLAQSGRYSYLGFMVLSIGVAMVIYGGIIRFRAKGI